MSAFMKDSINRNFKLIFEQLEKIGKIKSKSDMAARLGTYNHIINSVLKGERNITLEQMQKLVEEFDVNANYLMGVSGDMFRNSGDGLAEMDGYAGAQDNKMNIVLVPEKAAAGYALDTNLLDGGGLFKRFSVPGLEGNLVAFEIIGDSMLPTITMGDLVVCEALEQGESVRENGVYVVVTDSIVTKRVQQVKENGNLVQFRLISDNPRYQPYYLDLSEVRQMLRVKCRLTNHGVL
jgi:hypothetical protein